MRSRRLRTDVKHFYAECPGNLTQILPDLAFFQAKQMIRTKSSYKPVCDGLRILITRFYPRGVKRESCGVWMRSLTPSAGLLGLYKNSKIGWSEFEARLLSELRSNASSAEAVRIPQKSRMKKHYAALP